MPFGPRRPWPALPVAGRAKAAFHMLPRKLLHFSMLFAMPPAGLPMNWHFVSRWAACALTSTPTPGTPLPEAEPGVRCSSTFYCVGSVRCHHNPRAASTPG